MNKIIEAIPTDGEIYTMEKIFREKIKFYKGQSMSAQEILEESK